MCSLASVLDNSRLEVPLPVASATPPETPPRSEAFLPLAPRTLAEAGLTPVDVEALLLKCLWNRGTATGRDLADQVRLPFAIVNDLLRQYKTEQWVVYKSTNSLQDYQYELTSTGVERAQRYSQQSTYFGSAPVMLKDYVASVEAQSLREQKPRAAQVSAALKDLIIGRELLNQLGEAAHAAMPMFLFGSPGNGKTSIAERICQAFGQAIWIPRAVSLDGEIVRLFDPIVHEELPTNDQPTFMRQADARWVRIRRPTLVTGGELTLDNLELKRVDSVGIIEAPVQMKSNCGTLVIDDFGRQRISPTELLNRWIVPLERRYDFLNSPAGKKVRIPFDQLIIFSTNLAPTDLVDEAFLRRIPYKIEIPDPTEAEFRQILVSTAKRLQLAVSPPVLDYLIETHYRRVNRPFRACHARDLLQQAANHAEYHGLPRELTPSAADAAAKNYFAVQ